MKPDGDEIIQAPYPILRPQTGPNILQLLSENDSLRNFSILNLPRILVGSGGGTSFRIQGLAGEETERELRGVMVAVRPARVFWRENYAGGGSGKPPDCSSKDGLVGYGDPGGRCSECPNARFGSAVQPNGQPGNGQACKDIRQILFLRPDEVMPHLLNVPPTSLKAYMTYSMALFSRQIQYWAVETKLTLEKATSDAGKPYAKIVFQAAGRPMEPQEQAMLRPYHLHMKELLAPSVLDTADYQIIDDESAVNR
jgi:hypothetical protein